MDLINVAQIGSSGELL